ncbi:MAG: TrmH family RNA methyltransferase [Acidimicrobiia bacterium]
MAEALRLHRSRVRRDTGRTLLEGPHLLEEAVRAGAAVDAVFALVGDQPSVRGAAELGAELVVVNEAVLERLAPTEHPRGPVAIMRIPSGARAEQDMLLVPWGVGDPGNVGSLIRSAAAFEMGVVTGPETADPWAPKVLRAAAGGHFHATVEARPTLSLETLREAGYSPVAAVALGGRAPWELDIEGHLALLLGDEARGLPPAVGAEADARVTIPMPGGTESLNAGVAGAILAYEMRRRGWSPPP